MIVQESVPTHSYICTVQVLKTLGRYLSSS